MHCGTLHQVKTSREKEYQTTYKQTTMYRCKWRYHPYLQLAPTYNNTILQQHYTFRPHNTHYFETAPKAKRTTFCHAGCILHPLFLFITGPIPAAFDIINASLVFLASQRCSWHKILASFQAIRWSHEWLFAAIADLSRQPRSVRF